MNIQQTNTPLYWIPTLYFAMGLPFILLSMVSVLMFSDFGISNTKIAFWTSLILLPWTLKPIWSPLLEMMKTKKFFVENSQLFSGILFALIAVILPLSNMFMWAISCLLLIAISGATHDIAGDGIYLTALNTQTQARYIGWQGAFYNLAKILASGALVFLAGVIKKSYGEVYAWMIIMGICSCIMLLLSVYHRYTLPDEKDKKSQTLKRNEFIEVFYAFLKKQYIIYYIAFIIFYRFAEGFAIKIVPLFLKAPIEAGGLGLSLSDIGLIYGTFGVIAFVIGSILAGYYIAAYSLRRTLFSLCCVFNLPFIVYLLLACYLPDNLMIIALAIVIEYFGYGFGFVGLSLYMMQEVASGDHKMSHYAFASGIMNLGLMLPGMLSGYLSDMLGYKAFFIWVMIATIPAFIITYFVPFSLKNKLIN